MSVFCHKTVELRHYSPKPLHLYRLLADSPFFKIFSMQKGTVKFFNETKGFGFIVDANTGEEIFVHVSGLIDKIREGDVVTYETARGKKGMNAVDVQRA